MNKCEYCGNNSGLFDWRGNCISCGAPLPPKQHYREMVTLRNPEIYTMCTTAAWESWGYTPSSASPVPYDYIESRMMYEFRNNL